MVLPSNPCSMDRAFSATLTAQAVSWWCKAEDVLSWHHLGFMTARNSLPGIEHMFPVQTFSEVYSWHS